MMAVGILALLVGSFLAVHLRYLPDASSASVLAPMAPSIPAAPPPRAAASAARSGPSRPAAEGTSGLADALDLGVVQPVPMPAASGEWERRVNECIERRVRGRGEVEPTLPGRWPALKRAREERRLNRLAARTACEQELAR